MFLKRFVPTLTAICAMAYADGVEIAPGKLFAQVEADGKIYKIEREQKPDSYLTNTFALTSRPSPPFFIEPFRVTDAVETYGELEVIDFLENKRGIFIDARLEEWYEQSAIPGSVNIPFKLFLSDSPQRDEILTNFGGKKTGAKWDFSETKTILFYCNGAWCGQSPTAINALIDLGYPETKMKYYRGGMQEWQLLGLTTIIPETEVKK